jgi:hypothetical protein
MGTKVSLQFADFFSQAGKIPYLFFSLLDNLAQKVIPILSVQHDFESPA